MASLDASPPTITGSGTATATGTGTQGNQTDDRIQVTVPGCVTTLTIQYGNNPAGATGGRSFSIGNLSWSTSTLPVRFSQFTGQKITSGIIQLKWLSENGININKYEIERSTDGQNFVSAGSITALNPAGSYSFNDHVATQGTLFYRIKESDLDTRFQYSPVIALHFSATSNPGITVFPNPTTQSIFITTNDNSIIEKMIIFNSNGKIVFQKSGPENKVDVSQFSSGLYLLKIIKKTGDPSSSSFLKK
jgi:Secretion system C-terminal sorting domain